MRSWLVWGWVGCAAAATIAACGLDENGLDVGDASLDVTTTDASQIDGPADVQVIDVVQDVALPPTCSTTDVSCFGLGSTLPDGWSPYVYVPDGGACPSAAFSSQGFVTNTELTGGCVCSCNAQGTWVCPPTLQITGGKTGNCNPGSATIEAGVCQDVQTYMLDSIAQVGTSPAIGSGVGCEAGAPTSPVVAWNNVMMCAAGCDAGASAVCSAPNGTRRCIAADGVQPCPGSLNQIVIGGSADPSCNGCSCSEQLTAPTCSGVAHLFHATGQNTDPSCSNQGIEEDLSLTTTCTQAKNGYDSYFVMWNAAGPVTCQATGGNGDAGLTTPKTVCCTN